MPGKPFRLWAVVCAIAAMVAACGKDSPTSPSQTASSSGTSSGCSFTLTDPPAASLAAAGGEFTITVTTGTGCTWSASSGAQFMAPVGSTSMTGSSAVKFSVQPNPGLLRTGSVQVAGRSLTISQSGTLAQTCEFSVSPTEANVDAAGADVSIAVNPTSGYNCPWTAASTFGSHLTVKAGASGSGSGTVVVNVAANTGASRIGLVAVANRIVTLLQGSVTSSGCSFNVTPTHASVPSSGGPVVIAVTNTGGVCPWITISPSPWVGFSGPSSGLGNGTVALNILSNGSSKPRTLTVTVAGIQVDIDQDAAAIPCAFVLTPNSARVSASGGTVTAVVQNTQGSSCDWTANSLVPWLAVTSASSGRGNGSVTINAGSNSGPERGGSVIIGGQPLSITQDPGQTCGFSVSPTTISVPATQQFSTITVTNTQGQYCPWTVERSDTWLTYMQGTPVVTGYGSGSFSVISNTNLGAARTATLDIAGHIVTVNQAGQSMPANAVAVVSFQSDPGDYVGQGQTQSATFTGPQQFEAVFDASRGQLRFTTRVGVSPSGSISMQSPSGQPLAAGIFNRAQGWPVQTSSQPGLNVDWNSNGCAATGRFAIGQVVLDASGNLQKFHAAFEQHCDHSSAALRGTIWIDMQGSTTPPAPPVLPAVTTPTTFFSFTSDPGDVLGNGGSGSFALANSTFVASGESTQVSVRVAPNGTPFFFRFKSPNGQVLQPGTYDPVTGNLSSAGAALFTTGPGAVCSGTVSGRFTILEYVYGTQGDLYSFHATFELRCGTATAAFRGEIQVMADPWR